MDLFAERHEVRETAKRNLYTGKTYNSVENIQQFFAERGKQPALTATPAAAAKRPGPESRSPQRTPRSQPPRTKRLPRRLRPSGIPNMAAERCCVAKAMATMLSSR